MCKASPDVCKHKTPEFALKISQALTGRKQTPETVALRSAANKGKKRLVGFGQRLSAMFKGHKVSEATREKMSRAKLGTRRSEEAKRAVAEGMRRYCADPAVRKRRHDEMIDGGIEKRQQTNLKRYGRADGRFSDTWIEREAKSVLDHLGVRYQTQVGFCGTIVDFFLPDRRLVIETDGCFHHSCPQCHPNSTFQRIEKEKAVAASIASKGFRLVRVWEHDMKKFEKIIVPVLAETEAASR